MSVLARYLRREIVLAVVFVLVGFLALFAFFDFINELDEIGQAGYRLPHALLYVALNLPGHAYELMPIAVLIGTIYSLAQLGAQSEFTAMRAAGLSRAKALALLTRIGLIFAALTLLIGEALSPPAEQLAQRVRLAALGSAVISEFRSGLWIKDLNRDEAGEIQRMRFVNIATLLPDGSLQRVRVFEFDRTFRLQQILRATSGQFNPPDRWELVDVEKTDFSGAQTAADTNTVHAQVSHLSGLSWRSELNPDLLGVVMVTPDHMTMLSLVRYVHHLRQNNQGTERYEIALWSKVVYPLAILVMMALALPFAYLQSRAGGIGYKVFVGIMLGVGFHFLNGLFSHLGVLNTWPAWLSAALPGLAATGLALAMLAWVDRAR
jgi:lipopolysaccharide export system permease protein